MSRYLAVLSLLALEASAFWRLPCRGRVGLSRVDPLVDYGKQAMHAHSLHGGSAISSTSSNEDLMASDCTSCAVPEDKSAYWVPQMYFHDDATDSYTAVNETGGMLVYYLLRGTGLDGSAVQAFPEGFRMIAGDPEIRNYSYPDIATSFWTEEDRTDQEALRQKAIGYNCLDYTKAANAALGLHGIPSFNDTTYRCASGLRAEALFPSCWNGQDPDSDDHRSHVAYPSLLEDGDCPKGFEKRVPTLFFETIWNVDAFWDETIGRYPGQFVFSNGDPTGYGYHGDFMNAWDQTVLSAAIEQCTAESGEVEDCPVFAPTLQTEDKQRQCLMENDEFGEEDDGTLDELPGCNSIQSGPAYADDGYCDGSASMTKSTTPKTSSAAASGGIGLSIGLSIGAGSAATSTPTTSDMAAATSVYEPSYDNAATSQPPAVTSSASLSVPSVASSALDQNKEPESVSVQAVSEGPSGNVVIVTETQLFTSYTSVTEANTVVDYVTAPPVIVYETATTTSYQTVATVAAVKRHLSEHRKHRRGHRA